MNAARSRGALAAGALSLVLFAGCLDSEKDREPARGEGPDTTTYALARIMAFADGEGYTEVASYTYDAQGMRVRERTGISVGEWDSLGRYLGRHNVDTPDREDHHEILDWVGPDSNVRSQGAGGSIVFRDRFFGRRPNCWCADSIRHHASSGALIATRRFAYDTEGSVVLVTLHRAAPARVDTVQRYENAYLACKPPRCTGGWSARLNSRTVYDTERGDTSRQQFEYAPLDSLQETR